MTLKKMVMFLSIILLSFVTVTYGQTISIPDTTVAPGTTLNVPIRASNLNNVGAITLKLTYDASSLTYKGFTSKDVTFDPSLVNGGTPGQIKLAWFTSSAINLSNGILGYVQFTLNSGSSAVSFDKNACEIAAIPYSVINVNFINGRVGEAVASINVGSVEAKKADTVVVPFSAVNLKNIGAMSLSVKYNTANLKFVGFQNVATGLNVPSSNTSGTMNVGYMSTTGGSFNGKLFDVKFVIIGGNSDVTVSGSVTDNTTKDVTVAFNNGTVKELLPPPVKVGLSLPGVRGVVNNTVTVPLVVTEVDNIGALNLKIKYDASVLSFKEIKNFVGTASNLISKETNGVLTIGYFSTTPITIKNGKVLDVVFNYKGGSSDIDFDNSSSIADGNGNTVSITFTKGTIAANKAPVMAKVADQSVKENEKIQFTVAATDAENDPLTFTAPVLPKGAAFDGKTKTFTWTPTYSDSGKYAVKFFVADSIGSLDSTVANIYVVNVNRLPVFSAAFSTYCDAKDTLIRVDQDRDAFTYSIKFQYAATDPDGGKITYAILTGPAGATIDANGLLNYRPAKTAALGDFPLIVTASDVNNGVTKDSVLVHVIKYTSVHTELGAPKEYSLGQNYPNPFNPTTKIKYSVPQESKVVLKVYNMIGQEVAILVNQVQPAGNYHFDFNASSLPSGIYVYRLEAGNFVSVKKMTLLK